MNLIYKNIIKIKKDEANKQFIVLMDTCEIIKVSFEIVYTSDVFIEQRTNLYNYLSIKYNNGKSLKYEIKENDNYDNLYSQLDFNLIGIFESTIKDYNLTEHQVLSIFKALILNKENK